MDKLAIGINYVFENPYTSDINAILVKIIMAAIVIILVICTFDVVKKFDNKENKIIYRPPKRKI